MNKLQGLTAIVTGAGRMRGLGRAIALRLSQDGANVLVSAAPRKAESYPPHERDAGWQGVASVAEEINSKGGHAVSADCDVTDRTQVEQMIQLAHAQFGSIQILVNNAGVASNAGCTPIAEMDDDLWYRTIDVNLNGVYLVSKLAARQMIQAKQGGAIINVSSLAGRVGLPNYGAYCASKFAVIGLTQQMAMELVRHNIRVNCIAPGSTDTDMMDGTLRRSADRARTSFDDAQGAARGSIPMRRQGLPREQAAVVSFLAGPDASYITGQTVNVDGGLRMD